jgi:glycosyltransferase involved in cell wall biosynthesis
MTHDQLPRAPRVSIVIPAFNRADLIGRTVESVLAQTTTDWELVVFDDGSTDETAAVAAAYADQDARIRVLR